MDCARFYVEKSLGDPRLEEVEREIQSATSADQKFRAGLQQQFATNKVSPELQARMQKDREVAKGYR